MLKRLLLFLLLLPVALFSMSKAPEEMIEIKNPTILLNTYVNDYDARVLFYEGAPILSKNSSDEILNLIPILSQNYTTGEVGMQFLFSFYPNHPNDSIPTKTPKVLRVSSQKSQISIPLIDSKSYIETNHAQQTNRVYHHAVYQTQITNITNVHIKTSGSMFIFTEIASNFVEVIKDTRVTTYNTTTFGTMVPTKNARQVKFAPRGYTIFDLQAMYNTNHTKGVINEHTADVTMNLSIPFDNINNITLSFDTGDTLILDPYYTSVLYNFLVFYLQLSTMGHN